MHRLIIILTGTLLLFTAGCVSSQRSSPHASWPKPVTAKELQQFEGVFRNHSFDSQTGKAKKNANELVVFLLGPTHASADAGERVEIRISDDGQLLKLRLLDKQGAEIDSGTLRRGIDFDLADGRLILHGSYSGLRDLNNNFGPGLTNQHDRLYVTAGGDLLASTSQNSAMLVADLIPNVSSMKFWMFWPKLTK